MFETGVDAIFVLRRRTGQPMVLRPKHPGGGGWKLACLPWVEIIQSFNSGLPRANLPLGTVHL